MNRQARFVCGWLSLAGALAPSASALTTEIGPGDNLQAAVNALQRGGAADVGAYLWQADGNPGWILAEEFKVLLLIFLEGFESGDLSQWSGSLH